MFTIFRSYNICIIYLEATEASLKADIAMFYFFCWKSPSNIMKNIFDFISIYSLKKFPVNEILETNVL